MSNDVILQYLKSIDDRTTRMESSLHTRIKDVEDDVEVLQKIETRRAGIMIGGGAVVTFFSGLVTWAVNHLIKT